MNQIEVLRNLLQTISATAILKLKSACKRYQIYAKVHLKQRFYIQKPKPVFSKRENAKLTGENEFAQCDRGAGRPTKRQLRDIKWFTVGSFS